MLLPSVNGEKVSSLLSFPGGERNNDCVTDVIDDGKHRYRHLKRKSPMSFVLFHARYRKSVNIAMHNVSVLQNFRNIISTPLSSFFVEARKHSENKRQDIKCEYLADRHPCRHFRRHAVIASCIYAYYIRCDKTWLLECLVHCSASAGVD